MGCIQGLANALSGWDKEGKDGAVVVISHDREFCEKVGFTHVGTVKDGKLVLEQVSTLIHHRNHVVLSRNWASFFDVY